MLYIKVSNTAGEPVNVIIATDQNIIRYNYLLPGISRIESFPITDRASITFTSRDGEMEHAFVEESEGCKIYEFYY